MAELAQASTIEQLAREVECAIDNAPGDVAPDHCYQQLTRASASLVLDQQARTERKRQGHDQSEQHLAQRSGGIEVSQMDRCSRSLLERTHVCRAMRTRLIDRVLDAHAGNA